MLDVRFGDHGPRVALLQTLLNRSGNAGLVIDAAFGRHTAQAVNAARVRLLQSPGQIADADLWMALFNEGRLAAVDAFDMGEEHFTQGVAIVRSAGSRVVETGAMCNGIPSVIGGIVERAHAAGSLGLLRTWGHGNRGHWLSFTVGEVVHTSQADPALGRQIAAERGSYIDPDNFTQMAGTLAPVASCFAPFGIYEHHGCSLGQIAATRRMMARLADLWNVPVTVAMSTQFVPYDAATALRFQGHTFTAYPGGSESGWLARLRSL